jgi:hypothetical protein
MNFMVSKRKTTCLGIKNNLNWVLQGPQSGFIFAFTSTVLPLILVLSKSFRTC